MLDAGVSQGEVARRFGMHRTTINRLVSRVRNTQTTDDRPRSGRPRVMSHVQDRFIRLLGSQTLWKLLQTCRFDIGLVPRQFYAGLLQSVHVHGDHTVVLFSYNVTSTFAMGSQVLKMDNSSVGTSPIQ